MDTGTSITRKNRMMIEKRLFQTMASVYEQRGGDGSAAQVRQE